MPTYVCPTCGKTLTADTPQEIPHRPFCCRRCKLVDLGRWLDGTYVTSEPASPEDLEDAIDEGEVDPTDRAD